MKAITELDTLTSALDKLKEYRVRITDERSFHVPATPSTLA
jgi:hypothetical protein